MASHYKNLNRKLDVLQNKQQDKTEPTTTHMDNNSTQEQLI